MAFVDHRSGGSGEPVAGLLRPGNAGSDTAADHITTTQLALAQLPKKYRRGRSTLIRTDSAGGTHEFTAWLAKRGRWLSYSVGMTIAITDTIHQAVLKVPPAAWTAAIEPGDEIRDGAWVAELDGDVLKGWPKGMRLIVRKERPHPGAQLRFIDADGLRLTCFATNTTGPKITDLELRHRRRARAEDRIRNARDTGLRNLMGHEAGDRRPLPEPLSSLRRARSPLHDGSTTMRNLASDASGQTVGIKASRVGSPELRLLWQESDPGAVRSHRAISSRMNWIIVVGGLSRL